MTLESKIRDILKTSPDSHIIECMSRDTIISYKDLLKTIEHLENQLCNYNFEKKIILLSHEDNSLKLIIFYLLSILKGGIPLILESQTIDEYIKDINWYGIIFFKQKENEFSTNLDKVLTEFGVVYLKKYYHQDENLEEDIILLSSTGTTSRKKFIKIIKERLLYNIKENTRTLGITKEERTIICLPLYYSYTLVAQFFSHLLSGATIILTSNKFFALLSNEIIVKFKPTNIFFTPSYVRMLNFYQKKNIPYNFKFLTIGGGYIDKTNFLNFCELFSANKYIKTYGLSEAGPRVSTYIIDKKDTQNFEPKNIGKELRRTRFRYLESPVNYKEKKTFFLQVETPSSFTGYLNDEKYNSNIINTYDTVYINNNNVYILGRYSDRIIYDSESIWPIDIKEIFYRNSKGVFKVFFDYSLNSLTIRYLSHSNKKIDTNKIKKEIKHLFKNIEIKVYFSNIEKFSKSFVK